MNSPVAMATASLVAATIPPLVERRIDADPRVGRRQPLESLDDLGPRGAIVDHAPLPVRVRLATHAVDAGEERAERRVVDRGDDRESGERWSWKITTALP